MAGSKRKRQNYEESSDERVNGKAENGDGILGKRTINMQTLLRIPLTILPQSFGEK